MKRYFSKLENWLNCTVYKACESDDDCSVDYWHSAILVSGSKNSIRINPNLD